MLNWLEIDKRALIKNVKKLRERVGNYRIMAVVKANAYGHGAVDVSKILEQQGIDWLTVFSMNEALALRESGIQLPILILGLVEYEDYAKLFEYNLTPAIVNIDIARVLSVMAQRRGKKLGVHIKVDSGMNDTGFFPEEIVSNFHELSHLPGLSIDGLFSHFAFASDREYGEYQYGRMSEALFALQRVGIEAPLVHMSNSEAVYYVPKARFDMVRVGGLLYGLAPCATEFSQIMSFKTKIINLKEVPDGKKIGYGCTYETSKKSVIATLGVGYSDGYDRHLSNQGEVLIRGKRCKVAGRVCMNHIMVDVSDLKEVKINDEVVLFGEQEDEKIMVNELAKKSDTVNYEITARIPEHVVRLYIN